MEAGEEAAPLFPAGGNRGKEVLFVGEKKGKEELRLRRWQLQLEEKERKKR